MHYNEDLLNQHIKQKIIGLRPSEVPENIQDLVPDKIWNSMIKDIQKDIDELYMVYFCKQWTATSLMACRLLENSLDIHVTYDLNEDEVRNIGDAIKKLEKKGYSKTLIKELHEYREKRNDFMHGVRRASPAEAKDLVGYVMSLCLHIHNIEP